MIESHRGLPRGLNVDHYPKGYFKPDTQKMPKPDGLEERLIRDADTYVELIDLRRLMKTTTDLRSIRPEFTKEYYDPDLYGPKDEQISRRVNVILGTNRSVTGQNIPMSWNFYLADY